MKLYCYKESSCCSYPDIFCDPTSGEQLFQSLGLRVKRGCTEQWLTYIIQQYFHPFAPVLLMHHDVADHRMLCHCAPSTQQRHSSHPNIKHSAKQNQPAVGSTCLAAQKLPSFRIVMTSCKNLNLHSISDFLLLQILRTSLSHHLEWQQNP